MNKLFLLYAIVFSFSSLIAQEIDEKELIPEIKEHWNTIISNNPKMEYADYVVDKYLKNDTNLKMLSLGCGAGSHEIKFAKHSNFSEITGIDLAPKLIGEANKNAQQNNFKNLKYEVANIYDCYFDDSIFDVILFHSSLHHFKNLEKFSIFLYQ